MKLLASIIILIFPIALFAENALVVTTPDGQNMQFRLSEKPTVNFENGNLVITTVKETVMCPISQYTTASFTEYNEETNAINTGRENDIIFQLRDGIVTIDNLKDLQKIYCYDLRGKLVSTTNVTKERKAIINLSNLPKSTYILKIDNISYKVSR